MIHEEGMGTALGGQRSWWCPRILSHLVQRQLLLDVASHCIPDSLSLWKTRNSRFCCASAGSQPLSTPGCVSLLSPAPHGSLLSPHIPERTAQAMLLPVPAGLMLGIRNTGSIPSQKSFWYGLTPLLTAMSSVVRTFPLRVLSRMQNPPRWAPCVPCVTGFV